MPNHKLTLRVEVFVFPRTENGNMGGEDSIAHPPKCFNVGIGRIIISASEGLRQSFIGYAAGVYR
jgi:hypothetical protein